MKKITLTITLFLTAVIAFAQTTTVFEEDFATNLGDFTIEAGAGSAGTVLNEGVWHHSTAASGAAFIKWNGSMTDEYLISPTITVPSDSEARLSWVWAGSYTWMVSPNANGNLKVLVSTDGGTTWGTALWNANSQAEVEASGAPWPYENLTLYRSTIDLSSYAVGVDQDIKVAFEYVATDSDSFYVADFEVFTIDNATDANLYRIDADPFLLAESTGTIGGRIQNLGSDAITSFDVTYNVDGVDSSVFSISGENITYGNTFTFTHDATHDFVTAGASTINMTVSNINGNTDADTANNVTDRYIGIASSQEGANTPFFESFTSATCAPCATFNPFIKTFSDAHEDIAIVKYQVNWPGTGDPYYTDEIGVRRDYYGVNSVPTLVRGGRTAVSRDGNDDGDVDGVGVQTAYDTEIALGAFFDPIETSFIMDGNTITVDATMTSRVSGDFKVHMAIVEKETSGNTVATGDDGGNGETSFEYVMMKMLPDAEGTTVSFVDGQSQSLSLSHDMSTTFVEDMTDLAVVVFVQGETGYILQSAMSLTETANVESAIFESVSLYPNPSKGVLNIKTDKELQLSITNILGKTVFVKEAVNNLERVDISNLNDGVYFVKISDGVLEGTQKIILTK